jgi:hypothetical protein
VRENCFEITQECIHEFKTYSSDVVVFRTVLQIKRVAAQPWHHGGVHYAEIAKRKAYCDAPHYHKRLIKQITNTVLMVRPVQFRLNETAVNNYYQNQELQQQIEEKTYNKHGARRV